jgi:hypothetical protein
MGFLSDIGDLFFGFGRAKREKEGLALQREQFELEKKSQIADIEANLLGLDVQRQETGSNISAYEGFLERFPGYAQLEQDKFQAAGESQFRGLMENYGLSNVMAGATGGGGAGTSAGALGARARGDAVGFAGEDLSLAGGDGMYGRGFEELTTNLQVEEQTARQQLDIYRSSLETIEGTEDIYEDLLGELKASTQEAKLAEVMKNGPLANLTNMGRSLRIF